MTVDEPQAGGHAEAAEDYYSVEVTTETIGMARAWWRSALLGVLTVFWLNPSESPKLVTVVAVVRNSDGAVVESYEYHDPVQGSPHVQLMQDRLGSMTKAEFEAAVGIDS